jgi:hypothetical protein
MGGKIGGDSLRLSSEKLRILEERARAALRDSALPERRNVFLSFAYEDIDEVNLLRGQAKNENSNLEFNDWSVSEPFHSENAEYIRRGIRERIRQASVTLAYLSEHTAHSKWVDWEIRESIALGKGVIAVHKGDTPPTRLPAACHEFNVKVVPWNQQEIARAIEDAAMQ